LNTNHLAEAVAAKQAAIEEISPLQAQIVRLERHAQSASPAVAELNALREDTVRSFAAAAEADGELLIPAVDHKREAKLRDEIEAHRLSVDSANAAISTLVAQRNAAQKTRDGAARYATVAALKHMLETESATLFAEINAAAQIYVDLDARLDRLRSVVVEYARTLDERELYVAVEHLDKAKRTALFRPEPSADTGEWRAKLADLLSNANAKEAI
jgi:hypothetical protein